MIEKLKSIGEAAKNTVLYIIAPIAFIIGYIFILRKKNKDLETEIILREGDVEHQKLVDKQEQIDEEARSAMDEYARSKREYDSSKRNPDT